MGKRQFLSCVLILLLYCSVESTEYCTRLPRSKLIGLNIRVCFSATDDRDVAESEFEYLILTLTKLSSLIEENQEFLDALNGLIPKKHTKDFQHHVKRAVNIIQNIGFGTEFIDHLLYDDISRIKLSKSGTVFCYGTTCLQASININIPGENGRESTLIGFSLKVGTSWLAFGLAPVNAQGQLEGSFRSLTDWNLDVSGELRLPILRAEVGISLSLNTMTGIGVCLSAGVMGYGVRNFCFGNLPTRLLLN